MSRTPAEIEQVLRMMIAGKSHGKISEELYPGSENRPSNGVWFRFKNSFILEEKYKDKGGLKTDAVMADLSALGYTLTATEINNLFALAQGGLAGNRVPRKPATGAQRRWGSGTAMGSAPAAEAPREVGRPSANKPQEPLSIEFSSEWLSREGIPYAKAGEYGCTQPVGTIPGNVCGEQMPPARVEQRGLTICAKCHEATRQAGRTAGKGLKLPSIAHR